MNITTLVWLLSVTYSGTDIELLNASYGTKLDCIHSGNTVMLAWSLGEDLRTLTSHCEPVETTHGVGL